MAHLAARRPGARPTTRASRTLSAAPPDPLANDRAAVRGDRLRRPGRHHHQTRQARADAVFGGRADRDWVEPDLAVAALVRGVAGPPEQSDADVDRMFTRAMAWQECPSAATG